MYASKRCPTPVDASGQAVVDRSVRLADSMEKIFIWISAVVGVAGLIFGVIFFAATQQPNGRDWIALVLGFTVGAAVAVVVAAALFYRDDRARRLANDRLISEQKASAVAALPVRDVRVRELREQVRIARVNREVAIGNKESTYVSAQESLGYDMRDLAHEQLAASKSWGHRVTEMNEEIPDLERELSRIQALSDEEFLTEMKHLRGLD